MKILNSVIVFFLALNLSAVSFASAPPADEACKPESEAAACADKKDAHHGEAKAHHGDHSQVMNSLFPEKQHDTARGTRPALVELKSPAFMATVGVGNVKLEWAAAPTATEYHVQVATDPNFKWLVANEKFVKTNSYELTKTEAGKKYFWRVASFKNDNAATFTKSNFVSSVFSVK